MSKVRTKPYKPNKQWKTRLRISVIFNSMSCNCSNLEYKFDTISVLSAVFTLDNLILKLIRCSVQFKRIRGLIQITKICITDSMYYLQNFDIIFRILGYDMTPQHKSCIFLSLY